MKNLPSISDAEFEVMDVIWKYAPISTNEITDHLSKTKDWSPKTIYTMLSRLEKKDFIQLQPDETDRRCKRIYLLPKGREFTERIHRTILETETQMVQGFTEAEVEQFCTLLGRAITNMGGDPCHRKHKEEPTK